MSEKKLCAVLVGLLLVGSSAAAVGALTPKEKLGETIYHDARLSVPAGQACATCHLVATGGNGNGDASLAVYEGAVAGRFGGRNPPAAAYASFSPVFPNPAKPGVVGIDPATGLYTGGQFWDGRAATLADQAKGPFLNPAEQNNPSKFTVVAQVCASNYGTLFKSVYGANICSNTNLAYDKIADAIAAYESSTRLNRFSSRFDCATSVPTAQELNGRALFEGKGKCSACHPSAPGPYAAKALFTDYTYDNLGIPVNLALPPVGPPAGGPDLGLGAIVGDPLQNGKFKVPTLRNIAVAPPYGHNGYFKSLKEIVHFYNTRDLLPTCAPGGTPGVTCWPAPEVPQNVNITEMGNLGLTDAEEDDIVAFLMTLTDGYFCK